MLNFDIRKKENEHLTSKVINMHDSHYSTPSTSCIHGSHAVNVAAHRMSDFLIPISLHAFYTAVGLLKPAVWC